MRKPNRIVLLAGLMVTATLMLTGCTSILEGVSEYNAASESNDALATVGVGDCFDDATAGAEDTSETSTEVSGVVIIPCAEPHYYEVYDETKIPDGEYPTDINTLVDDFCFSSFETFVGMPYDTSELYYSALYPSVDSWNDADDRDLKCLIQQDGIRTSGSLANAAR